MKTQNIVTIALFHMSIHICLYVSFKLSQTPGVTSNGDTSVSSYMKSKRVITKPCFAAAPPAAGKLIGAIQNASPSTGRAQQKATQSATPG
jgi:hypothetical protein